MSGRMNMAAPAAELNPARNGRRAIEKILLLLFFMIGSPSFTNPDCG
jgi:hypothetical protein